MVAKLDAWYFLILDKARTDDIINGLAELIRLVIALWEKLNLSRSHSI